jgi:hypothetical protein
MHPIWKQYIDVSDDSLLKSCKKYVSITLHHHPPCIHKQHAMIYVDGILRKHDGPAMYIVMVSKTFPRGFVKNRPRRSRISAIADAIESFPETDKRSRITGFFRICIRDSGAE